MVDIKFKNDSYEKRTLVYIDSEKDIGIGTLLDEHFFLFYKWGDCYPVDKNQELLIALLTLLELNVIDMKNNIEAKNHNFYDIVPVEKILMTAFYKNGYYEFSLYWRVLALNWIEDLKFKTPWVLNLLEEKSRRDYKGLPIPIKVRIRKIKQELT